jgi:hypothetical protein
MNDETNGGESLIDPICDLAGGRGDLPNALNDPSKPCHRIWVRAGGGSEPRRAVAIA